MTIGIRMPIEGGGGRNERGFSYMGFSGEEVRAAIGCLSMQSCEHTPPIQFQHRGFIATLSTVLATGKHTPANEQLAGKFRAAMEAFESHVSGVPFLDDPTVHTNDPNAARLHIAGGVLNRWPEDQGGQLRILGYH